MIAAAAILTLLALAYSVLPLGFMTRFGARLESAGDVNQFITGKSE